MKNGNIAAAYLVSQNNQISQQNLIVELKSNNKDALSYLYDQYSAALLGVITRIVNDKEMSNDVLQETFIKIWKNMDSYDESKSSLFTWMLNIARNSSIDVLRSKGYRNAMSNKDIDSEISLQNASGEMGIKMETIGVKKLVASLKDDEQELIDLLYFQGYSQSEAADELRIPIGTVKTKARGAILKLRKFFN